MPDHRYGFETLCLHAGQPPDATTGARAMPIYQTTSFVFDSPEHAAALFNLQTFGNVYSRISNPTVAAFEERMAALEGGRAALATASGLSAQMVALLTLCEAGDEIVAARTLYGGSYSQLDVSLRKLGINTHFVDPADPEAFRAAINDKTRVVYGEVIGNPGLNVLDITAIAEVAHASGVPLVIDSTLASPYLCRPIEHGADIVIHSATKYIGGHGTTMGGVIIESGKFPWDNGRFPALVEPSRGYHGVNFYETFGDFGFTMKARMETLRTFGPALSPFSAFMLLQGLETLPVRMDRHVANAMAVAKFLAAHPMVAWVNYPGLDTSPDHSLAQRYFPKGAGGILSFGIAGGQAAGERFINAVQMISHLANVGDAKTLVIHPASTTHRQLSEAEQRAAGVPPDMVRLSVGIETEADILWDLDQALAQAGKEA
ncbi:MULTISPECIES: O-acetylhomoserine aminocarboxypropyltransferase/cysteine synthase family protein [Denitromonas]|uniref:O-acetylhomoserine aminocarboxypropyltransferase/cysteine synthase n=2 Tax=Denitromonas TaxID=139331 RepID=A0A557SKT4_9RHOO|nr:MULTISPECIES: O-acetylhomoserine aminocarboxypropyltransferase/cysteine synthase family protein [Denitromonas]TVO57643.1 O-acetylhomoserine aminocarboxypropyltransferase/cysteine synthase [Denitromonas halophila]TVO68082.1 O-acetylhomoserine aminocarboxypropyltransferase/cysteine synthase [Denitromonas ohlonensis]TVO78013.1 O-acetylhomoserine aminocarboxypropyltransferase/cysteine synthase [Denitromonas ohlonensis]